MVRHSDRQLARPALRVISADDIRAAERRVRSHIRHTPVWALPSPHGGPSLLAKAEHLQTTGSFKLRGAFNRLLTLSEDDRRRGVVAASSGNHGAAVAHASHVLGIEATVYVPEGASPPKVAKIRDQGARVLFVGTDGLDTEQEARRAAEASGRPYISPYNDEGVMAGQGTLAAELVRDAGPLDRVYVAVGGGGLIGGMAIYLAAASPETRVVGVLPAASPHMAVSVAAGRIVDQPTRPTLSDGTAGGIEPGAITFEACARFVHGWMTVSESEIAAAMRWWSGHSPDPIEGAAGVAIAGCLRDLDQGGRSAFVVCGGNVAPAIWDGVIAGKLPSP